MRTQRNKFSPEDLAALGAELGGNAPIMVSDAPDMSFTEAEANAPDMSFSLAEAASPGREPRAPSQAAPSPRVSALGKDPFGLSKVQPAQSDPAEVDRLMAEATAIQMAENPDLDRELMLAYLGDSPGSSPALPDQPAQTPVSGPASGGAWVPRANHEEDAARRSEERAAGMSFVSDLLQGFDTINQGFGAPRGAPILQGMIGAEQNRAQQAMKRAAALREQQKDSDPNDPRAVAIRDALAKQGIDVGNMGFGDLVSSGLVPQSFISQRDAKQQASLSERYKAEREQETLDSETEFKRKQDLEEQKHGYRLEEIGAKRRGRGGGGKSGGAQSGQNFSPEALERDRAALKQQGFSDTAIDQMKRLGAKGAQAVYAKETSKSTAPADPFNTVRTGNGTSLTMSDNASDELKKVMAERSKSQHGDDLNSGWVAIRNLESIVGENPGAYKLYRQYNAIDRKDMLRKLGTLVGSDAAKMAAKFDRVESLAAEAEIRAKSGAAVPEHEYERLKRLLGAAKDGDVDGIKDGIAFLKERFITRNKSLASRVARDPAAHLYYWQRTYNDTKAPFAKAQMLQAEAEAERAAGTGSGKLVTVIVNGKQRVMSEDEAKSLVAQHGGQ